MPSTPDYYTPTEYLILEVLAARARTGESHWTFPTTLRPAVKNLQGLNLVSFKEGIAQGTLMVWLTEAGKEASTDPTYVGPTGPEITVETLARLHEWNLETFGPGARTAGTLEHLRRELVEIEADPSDVMEWADVVILGLNGVLRMGYAPDVVLEAILTKLRANELRMWPDWRTVPEGTPIEHIRDE